MRDERAAFAAMHGPDLLYFGCNPWPWGKPHEAAGIHRTSRQRGSGVAARGASPAVGQAADHWVHGPDHAFSCWRMDRRFCAATARTGLDRRSQPCDRVSLGEGRNERFVEIAAEF